MDKNIFTEFATIAIKHDVSEDSFRDFNHEIYVICFNLN